MTKLIFSVGVVALMAAAQSAGFAAVHHGVKAKVHVAVSHAKSAGLHTHAKIVCPTTPQCKCD